MMKKSRKLVMEPDLSSSSTLFPVPIGQESRLRFHPYPVAAAAQVGEEGRARFKHQSLLQDYLELLKETEEKKKKLVEMNQRKCQLMAELKFLRRKFESFAKTRNQETTYWLPEKSSMSVQNTIQTVKEAAISTPALLDLNQISIPTAEEMQECSMEWADNAKRFSMEKATGANDFKRSVVRDVVNGSSKIRKREISWQDQVTLRAS